MIFAFPDFSIALLIAVVHLQPLDGETDREAYHCTCPPPK